MPVVQVVSPGLQSTVQDLGRPGHGPLGVSASGAADPLSLRIGNRLLGNPEGAAALEMTLLGGAYLFPDGAEIAVAGSDFKPNIDTSSVPMWTPVLVRTGQTLRFGHTQTGARCYLCIRGGVRVPLLFGSASTHLLSGLGGLDGRAVRKGDVLEIGGADAAPPRRIALAAFNRLVPRRAQFENCASIFRVTEGPQADWFSAAARNAFYDGPYAVTEEANRMGLRLEGPAIECPADRHMITEGVALGAVQVPSGGQPILLGVEQQTAGGYPKIANVISADLALMGQLRPRDEVRFKQVSMEVALQVWREQEMLLESETWMES